MSFFGAVFIALTLYWQWHISGLVLTIPFVVSAGIWLFAFHVIRLPGEGIGPSKKAGRVIAWSSIAEGIGFFLAANILVNLHRADLLLPVMALIVGLHFLPIAFAASFQPFYALGVALIFSAAIGFIMHAPTGGMVSGLMAGFGLWTAAILAVKRDQQTKSAALAT